MNSFGKSRARVNLEPHDDYKLHPNERLKLRVEKYPDDFIQDKNLSARKIIDHSKPIELNAVNLPLICRLSPSIYSSACLHVSMVFVPSLG